MKPDTPSPTAGEVVALEEAGVRVRLDDGRQGSVPTPAATNLKVGSRSIFRVERTNAEGELILAVAASAEEPPPHSFDREFDRLHDALANHGPRSILHEAHEDALGEKRIEQWMMRVDETVADLRKRRARRLDGKT
jgi:hypothetical protein